MPHRIIKAFIFCAEFFSFFTNKVIASNIVAGIIVWISTPDADFILKLLLGLPASVYAGFKLYHDYIKPFRRKAKPEDNINNVNPQTNSNT